MRRTVLSATAAACVAVLANTVPAFAHGASATPTTRPSVTAVPSTSVPSARPSAPGGAEPSAAPSRVPSAAPARTAEGAPTPVPSAAPARGRGQVAVVPSGAPDTGVTTGSSDSGNHASLVGSSAVGSLVVGGTAVFLLRRRRATGA
ncbi:Tat pathway signal sequence domain protein [Streptomyces sp. SID4985]|uniref:Tat pathway signal sequence domain protein n=1 Tax=unclassified Streptomyces TaxID=2593676 RepID=UPI00136F5ACD|nr:Tat pathway signal sequence domain protein [Streptomyces sp. SID4985]MYQ44436.1 Tat pathway signal sequence domain protein [Streptomyces sp. SID4985]